MIASGAMQPGRPAAEVERAKADGRWDAAYSSPKNDRDPRGARTRGFARNADGPEGLRDARQPQPLRGAVPHRDAKKPETRERLAKKFVEMLAKGETIHPRPERKR